MAQSYEWYEQDFTAFLLSLNLPAYYKDTPMKEAIEAEKALFVEKFKSMISKKHFRGFSDSFYDTILSFLPEIKKNFDVISDIIDSYDHADMAAAQIKFDEMMKNLLPHLFVTDIFWPWDRTTFFRIRVSENEKLKEPKDLFHIPYKKRHLVTNERYSLAGHPCLYLASMLYISWQECGYPHKYYYSEFQYQRVLSANDQWLFLTFLSPQRIARKWFVYVDSNESEYIEQARSALLTYPLIFACSIVNQNGDSAFKPEYVIPQMLTQWVYRNDIIKGIKYFSCCDANDTRVYDGFNVVLPVKNIDYRRGFSKDLVSKFKVTTPEYQEHRLGESEASTISQFKKDLLNVMRDTFAEANECLSAFYTAADLLEKAVLNTEKSNMQFVVSAVQNVSKNGQIILRHYKKMDIIGIMKFANPRPDRLDEKIATFSSIYDRFSKDIIDIAKQYDTLIDRIPPHKDDDFRTV